MTQERKKITVTTLFIQAMSVLTIIVKTGSLRCNSGNLIGSAAMVYEPLYLPREIATIQIVFW